MNAATTIPTSESGEALLDDTFDADKRGHKGRERKCVASGEITDIGEMVRFVLSPDNVVTPDILGKLPGRGVWVSADAWSLDKAIKNKAFARGFKGKAIIPDELSVQVETLLARRALGLLTMALRGGQILMGFDQVRSGARSDVLAWRIEASDGSEDGRGKIRVLSKAMSHELELPMAPVAGCFTSEDLGQAFGRETMVHAALKHGKLAKTFSGEMARLAGFRNLIPDNWPDKAHETTKNKAHQHRD